MSRSNVVFEVEYEHFTVRLYENMLRIDLKGSFRNELEEALENKPLLKQTLGGILGIFAPLHVHLIDIDSAGADKTGKVKIKLPHHRDITIPLKPEDAEKIVEKLNQMIPVAKKQNWERIIRERKRARQKSKGVRPRAYDTMPYYFPTEQVDIVKKFNRKKKKK